MRVLWGGGGESREARWGSDATDRAKSPSDPILPEANKKFTRAGARAPASSGPNRRKPMFRVLLHRAELDRVDEAVLGEDVGRDDEFVTRRDAAGLDEQGDGVFDRGIWLTGERH